METNNAEILELMKWLFGIGIVLIMAALGFIWKNLISKIDQAENRLTTRIEKLDEKVTDIDRRLCRLEGAFASKDCCMIKDNNQMRKAE